MADAGRRIVPTRVLVALSAAWIGLSAPSLAQAPRQQLGDQDIAAIITKQSRGLWLDAGYSGDLSHFA